MKKKNRKPEIEDPIYFLPKNHTIGFEVPGKPFGKQRPRVVTRGGFARAYTPRKTVDYEEKVKSSYYEEAGKYLYKLDGNIEATIDAIFEVPKSVSKKKRETLIHNHCYYTKKPDCDNIAKSILDALNGYAYLDDSQICVLHTTKTYGETAKVKVTLKKIE